MILLDFSWSGGFVVGIQHTDTAVIETGDDTYQFCNAIIISLGFFCVSLLMTDDSDDDDGGGTPIPKPQP
jgi:hypothetical protein